jgi:ABC-type branched-subunit amino acid transport system ATPase component
LQLSTELLEQIFTKPSQKIKVPGASLCLVNHSLLVVARPLLYKQIFLIIEMIASTLQPSITKDLLNVSRGRNQRHTKKTDTSHSDARLIRGF